MSFTAEAVRKEMRSRIGSIVELSAGERRKIALEFAAKILRLPIGRVRALYYGEARRVDAHEADQIRAYFDAAQDLIQRRAEYEVERARFIAEAHPALGALAPPSLGKKRKRA